MPHVPCSISNVAARRPARLSPVLTVKTDRGEFILDNQEPQVLPWTQTGYRFVKRQSQTDPNLWVSLGEPRAAPATVSVR